MSAVDLDHKGSLCFLSVSATVSSSLFAQFKMSSSLPACGEFTGNSDLYGLGIRIGVYLQWVSSWLSNTFDSDSVAGTHTANSVFVFAIIIAVVQAAASKEVRPVEAFIMLQICFGYLVVALSLLGVRIQWLTPGRTLKFVGASKDFPSRIRAAQPVPARQSPGTTPNDDQHPILPRAHPRVPRDPAPETQKSRTQTALHFLGMFLDFRFPMGAFAYLKHRTLSWSGVIWRAIIYTTIAVFNLWLWFGGKKTLFTATTCNPVVFFFSRQELEGDIITFFKVGGIVFGVYSLFILFVLVQIALNMLYFAYFSLTQLAVFKIWGKVRPNIPHDIQDSLARLSRIMGNVLLPLGPQGVIIQIMLPYLNPIFWAIRREDIPHPRDLVKAYALLSSGRDKDKSKVRNKIHTSEEKARYVWRPTSTSAQSDRVPRWWHKAWCYSMHVLALVAIAWLMACVELTLKWNNVQGVNTVKTTGQLIPFIIGIVGFIRAINDVILAWIRKVGQPEYVTLERSELL